MTVDNFCLVSVVQWREHGPPEAEIGVRVPSETQPYLMLNYEKELNKEQLRVVREGDGACLVLSGPGSGKTRTLVYRTAYLLEKGVPAEQILLLTFTKKAAKEMLSRIFGIFGNSREGVNGGTFHHAGNLFLRRYAPVIGYNKNFIIMDDEDSRSMFTSILKERSKKIEIRAPIVQSVISLSVNSKKSIERILEENFPYIEEENSYAIEEIAVEYNKRKKEGNLMDYDDLLFNWLKILSFKEVKREISSRFSYVLVDEYQDTNAIQDEIVKNVTEEHGNILAVGDDSQSIFSFRAADIKNILRFSNNYPGAKIFHLETNYRSTPQILTLANEVIKNNEMRLDKQLRSTKKDGRKPIIIPLDNSFKQAEFVISQILKMKNSGIPFSEMAVLFRAHYQSAELELEFAKQSIPYVMRGGMKFFEQLHVKDLSAFLRIIVNFRDHVSWKRLLSRLDGVGKTYSDRITKSLLEKKDIDAVYKDSEEISLMVPLKARKEVLILLHLLKEASIEPCIQKIIEIFLSGFYGEYLRNSFENGRERINDLNRFRDLAGNYDDMEKMICDFSLSEEFKTETDDDKKEKITLSTIHQAKGLEWDTVFVISLREGDFPYVKAIEEGSLEEERRLFYVAVTRCKNNLFLTYPIYTFRGNGECEPSRFLKEAEGVPSFSDEIEELKDDDGWESF